ncbi:hypothetical protein [Paenibacillus piri]|uniref:Uncharacterized protein n=1 Tax=Paenibacillus piri TaxID=2547395 RepID=A0A4R5KL74_9BACL|nr:hypothetical protein [Paenibacillus piri]TDF95932.1 hypothetical protein E1757_19630 [Paenibacillus piri]
MLIPLVYFGVTFWFGLYMLNRDWRNMRLLLAGMSLIIGSAGIGAMILLPYAQSVVSNMAMFKIRDISLVWSLILWQGVIAYPHDSDGKQSVLWELWKYGFAVLALLVSLVLLFMNHEDAYTSMYQIAVCLMLVLMIALTVWGGWTGSKQAWTLHRAALYLPLVFYTCMTVILLVQTDMLKPWGYAATGVGLLAFAVSVMVTEIRKQGETWLPDVFRSLDYSIFFTLLFSGQVALVIHWGAGFNFMMAALLLLSIAVSIAFQVFVYPIRALLDNIAFVTFPKLRQTRSRLRFEENIQVRVDEEAASEEMGEDDLYRYTRRALSHFGDLQRLASNPLAQMNWIDERLRERGAANEVLERAIELKSVLSESIQQLKPRGDEQFGTTEEWRHFNALYFPYVVGIKPYSSRYSDNRLDAAAKAALTWYRANVPERTFYNWQNAGAKVIALSLRDRASVNRK